MYTLQIKNGEMGWAPDAHGESGKCKKIYSQSDGKILLGRPICIQSNKRYNFEWVTTNRQ
jgi:hypothetical protein